MAGKTGNSSRKIKWLALFRFESFREYGLCFEAKQFFILFWLSLAYLDILGSGSFSHPVKFYSFTFMHTIFTIHRCALWQVPTCQQLNVTLRFSQQTLGLSRRKRRKRNFRNLEKKEVKWVFLTRQGVVQTGPLDRRTTRMLQSYVKNI